MVKKHDKYELVECCYARSLHEIASDQLKYAITYFAIHFLFIFTIYFPFTFSISSLVLVFSPMSIVLSLSLCLWFIFGILAFRETLQRRDRDRAKKKQIASEAWFSVEQIDTALYHRTCTLYIPYSILKYHKSKGMTHSFRPETLNSKRKSRNEKNKYTTRIEFYEDMLCLRKTIANKRSEETQNSDICRTTRAIRNGDETKASTNLKPLRRIEMKSNHWSKTKT